MVDICEMTLVLGAFYSLKGRFQAPSLESINRQMMVSNVSSFDPRLANSSLRRLETWSEVILLVMSLAIATLVTLELISANANYFHESGHTDS